MGFRKGDYVDTSNFTASELETIILAMMEAGASTGEHGTFSPKMFRFAGWNVATDGIYFYDSPSMFRSQLSTQEVEEIMGNPMREESEEKAITVDLTDDLKATMTSVRIGGPVKTGDMFILKDGSTVTADGRADAPDDDGEYSTNLGYTHVDDIEAIVRLSAEKTTIEIKVTLTQEEAAKMREATGMTSSTNSALQKIKSAIDAAS